MPSKSISSTPVSNGLGYMYPRESVIQSWNHSPKVNGKPLYRANTVYHQRVKVLTTGRKMNSNNHSRTAIYGTSSKYSSPPSIDSGFTAQVQNRAYRRLINTIRGEKAEMGITAFQWRQSWTMIALRANQIRKIASKAERQAARENKRRKALRARNRRARGRAQGIRPRDLVPVGSANVFLEGIFGWLPLLSDIHQYAKVVADDFPVGFLSETVKQSKRLAYPLVQPYVFGDASLEVRVTQACFVQVSNPNVWLLNKLGLINPALVVWDAIPWSFVVNMFANVNHVISSYTDTAGLTLTNASTTTRWRVQESCHLRSLPGYDQIEEFSHFDRTVKSRQLGLTLPVLQTKLPKLEWGTALIAVSLMAQQISRLKFFK